MFRVLCFIILLACIPANAQEVWRDKYGRTQLHNVAQQGDIEQVRELMTLQPELLEMQDFRGHTPLFLMAWKQNLEMTDLLIRMGANIHARDYLGRTPLMVAAYHNNAEIVGMFLEAGASPHTCDSQGNTALHLEAQTGIRFDERAETIRLLLEAGADIHAVNNAGVTPLSLALRSTWPKRADTLKLAGAKR